MADWVLVQLTAAAYALLFAGAAWHKLRARGRFREILAGYRLLPAALLPLAAWSIPLIEGMLAAGLCVGATRGVAAPAGALLLLGYALAIAINLRRGRRDLSCGCGRDGGLPIAGWMAARNVLLALLLMAAALPVRARAFEAADAVTLVLGVVALALVYAVAEQLLATATRVAAAGRTR